MLAANTVTKAEPDGHSLAVVTVSLLAIGPSLFKDFRFTPTRDFTTVSVYLQSAFVLVASPALGLSDLNSLVARAKGQGQQPLSYSSLGPGSAQHLSMELVKQLLGFEMIHVPYTSTPQSVLDIVGGSVSCGFIEAATAIPLVREGKLSGLAVSTSTSLPELPDVPPIAVAARVPGLEYVGWHAVIAHAATPKPIVERLNGEMNAIMTEGDMRQRLATLGLAPMKAMNLEETRDYVIAEQRKWGEVVRKLGLEGSQ
jgi:tripartite-type tricarboxylate transporter receptor subunit TctC